jgi:hypothetical protein
MSTTMTNRTLGQERRKPPTEAEIAEIRRLWRLTPHGLHQVRNGFIAYRKASGDRRGCGSETVLRYRPDDLAWPTRDERIRAGWCGFLLTMDGPKPKYVAPKRPKPVPAKASSVVVKPAVCGQPPRRTLDQVMADWQADRDGDPTPEQIREMCRDMRRKRGEIVLLEIDLR